MPRVVVDRAGQLLVRQPPTRPSVIGGGAGDDRRRRACRGSWRRDRARRRSAAAARRRAAACRERRARPDVQRAVAVGCARCPRRRCAVAGVAVGERHGVDRDLLVASHDTTAASRRGRGATTALPSVTVSVERSTPRAIRDVDATVARQRARSVPPVCVRRDVEAEPLVVIGQRRRTRCCSGWPNTSECRRVPESFRAVARAASPDGTVAS